MVTGPWLRRWHRWTNKNACRCITIRKLSYRRPSLVKAGNLEIIINPGIGKQEIRHCPTTFWAGEIGKGTISSFPDPNYSIHRFKAKFFLLLLKTPAV